MYLASLKLTDFRNFRKQELVLPPEGAAVMGDNGQGKTNLLESIYYLEIFRSFRGAPDPQLVRFGAELLRVEADVIEDNGNPRRVTAAYQPRGARKKVTVDAVEPERLADALGSLSAVIFSPTDVEIVAGSPGGRRRFLNIVLSLSEPGYLRVLQQYRQTLSQRNAELRASPDGAAVAAWNGGLCRLGGRVVAARARWCAAHRGRFGELYRAVSGGEGAAMDYAPSVALPSGAADADEATVAEAFLEELNRSGERERRRGVTVVGPHRDDLRLTSAGRDLRTYGSGGQQRTAAIALRMVEADTLREARNRDPIILLDDVFAELDPGRSSRILKWIDEAGSGQVILTAPKPAEIEVRGASLRRFEVREGVLRAL